MTEATPERGQAVAACIADVRSIIAEEGVNREALERVKERLLKLAARRDLFAFDQFPVLHQGSTMHLLSEDDDHGFALYAVAARGVSETPPHDHTTWAVVVGVEGEERNRLHRRIGGGEPGETKLEPAHETLVRPGVGVALMPDDVHSIRRESDAPMLHFHLYGRSIEHLPERRKFDLERGTSEVYPANPRIKK